MDATSHISKLITRSTNPSDTNDCVRASSGPSSWLNGTHTRSSCFTVCNVTYDSRCYFVNCRIVSSDDVCVLVRNCEAHDDKHRPTSQQRWQDRRGKVVSSNTSRVGVPPAERWVPAALPSWSAWQGGLEMLGEGCCWQMPSCPCYSKQSLAGLSLCIAPLQYIAHAVLSALQSSMYVGLNPELCYFSQASVYTHLPAQNTGQCCCVSQLWLVVRLIA